MLDEDDNTQYTYDDDNDYPLPANQLQDASNNDNIHNLIIESSPPRYSNLYASEIDNTIGTQIVNQYIMQSEDISSNIAAQRGH